MLLRLQTFLNHPTVSQSLRPTFSIMSTLTEIAEGILANAKGLDALTASKNLASSSFETYTLANLPKDGEDLRKALVDSTQELRQLAVGPIGQIFEILFSVGSNTPGLSGFEALICGKADVIVQVHRRASPPLRLSQPARQLRPKRGRHLVRRYCQGKWSRRGSPPALHPTFDPQQYLQGVDTWPRLPHGRVALDQGAARHAGLDWIPDRRHWTCIHQGD